MKQRKYLISSGALLVVIVYALQASAQTIEMSGWYAEPRHTHFTTAIREAAAELAPEISIEFGPSPTLDSLLTWLAAGTLPDVITMHHSGNFPPLVNQNGLIPLDGYVDKYFPEFWNVVPPELIAPFQRGGRLYAIPAVAELNNVYVNLTMLSEAGLPPPDWNWDWNDLLEMSRLVTRDLNGDGVPERYGAAIRPYEQELGPFIYSNGGSYMNHQAEGTEVTIDSPETIAALEFVRSLIHDYQVALPTWERSRWEEGNLAFFFDGSWDIGTFQMTIGDRFVWDYIPYPRSPATGRRASRLSVVGVSVSSHSGNPEAAARVAQLVATAMVQEAYLRAGLSPIPVRLDLFDSPFMPSPDQVPRSASRTIMETLTQGEAIAETVYPDQQMQSIALNYIEQVLINGTSPQVVMPEAARLMRAYLKQENR